MRIIARYRRWKEKKRSRQLKKAGWMYSIEKLDWEQPIRRENDD